MRLAMVSTQFTKIGGVENVMREVASRLSKKHKIHLITRDKEATTDDFEEFWEDVWVIPDSSSVKGYFGIRKDFAEYIRKNKIDVIQFHNTTPFAPFIFSPLRKKSVITLHGTITGFYRDMRSLKFPLGWLFEEVALNTVSKVTTITNAHLGDFLLFRDVELIRNGVDLARFNPKKFNRRKLRKKYGLKGFTPLFLSKMMKNKGGDYFVRAAERMPEKTFLLAGDGPDRERVERMAPDNVKCMGRVSKQEKLELYAASDLFVLPTISEGFPLVILEAMAMGLPILTTDIWGIKEVMEGRECAIMVEPRSVGAVVDVIKGLSKSPKELKKMGKAGRHDAEEEFSWDAIADEYEKIFLGMIED